MRAVLRRHALQSKGLWRSRHWAPGLTPADNASDAGQSKRSLLGPSSTPRGQDSGSGSFRGTPVSFGDAKIDEDFELAGPSSPTKFGGDYDGDEMTDEPGMVTRVWRAVLTYYRRMMRPWSDKTGYDMYLYVAVGRGASWVTPCPIGSASHAAVCC